MERMAAARGKYHEQTARLAVPWVEPKDLKQSGWGVIFGRNIHEEIKRELRPLLDLRREQAGGLYREFEPYNGQTVRDWLEDLSVSFGAVNPAAGVPLYLLLVGAPDEIPFEFQYLLDAYWCVGRLDFDTPAEYGAYARAVVASEKRLHPRLITVFAPRNDHDQATGFFHGQVARVLVEGSKLFPVLGKAQGFQLHSVLAERATKPELIRILKDKRTLPALLVSGSHGVFSESPDENLRRERVGALVTQEWRGPGTALSESTCLTAEEFVQSKIKASGLIHFFFACYSAGCPEFDTYRQTPDGIRFKLLNKSVVSRLPQRMLASGALAVIGHIDRAFSSSFQTSRLTSQIQDIYGILTQILNGVPVGQAVDHMNLRWCVLSAELAEKQKDARDVPGSISDEELANYTLMRDDARNYIILGDPAVRLTL
jgi:hypothetical protein